MDLSLFMTTIFWALCYVTTRQIPFKLKSTNKPVSEDLVLVHVLFRHGDRTANGPEELYPRDPYVNETYFPIGLGQLTKAGKRREFSIGTALRRRYNDFLGEVYYPEIVEAVSTDYNRTKASLELVLAGLFPPKEEDLWNPWLRWEPIPYNYLPSHRDKVLIGVYCPNYERLCDEYVLSSKHQSEVAEDKQTFDYISANTGLNITTLYDVYNLYFGLATEDEWGFELPAWTKKVWPEVITNLAIKYYSVETGTTNLIRMVSGYFFNKVLADTIAKMNHPSNGRKVHLYSAHENNIADALITLGVFEPRHVPPYGSFIVFEVHRLKESYGIKIYYENYSGQQWQLLKLPACEEICEINKFVSLIEEHLPSEDLCGF